MLTPRISPSELITDLAPEDLPPQAVSAARNVLSFNGKLQQALPFEDRFGTTLVTPEYLIPNNDQSEAYQLYAGPDGVAVTDGATHTNLTPAGWLAPTDIAPFSGGIINQLPVLNTGAIDPLYWDQSAATMATLPGWPAGDRCKCLRPFREYLIAMDITTGGVTFPDLLRWSDAAPNGDVPQDWTPSQTSDAGERNVAFLPGALVDGKQLGDRFYLYKTGSTFLLQYIAGAFIFSQRPVFSTVGLLSRDCVVEYRGRHICLTDGDLVAHDGVNVESIVNEKVRAEIFQNLDGDNFERSYLALDKERGVLLVCRPRTGEKYPGEALQVNLSDGRIAHQKLITLGCAHIASGLTPSASGGDPGDDWDTIATTWDTEPSRWNDAGFQRTAENLTLADPSGLTIQQLNFGSTQAGDPISAELRRDGLAITPDESRAFISRLFINATAAAGVKLRVTVGATDTPDQQPSFGAERTFTVGVDRWVNVDGVEGRYVSYRIRADAQTDWRLNSIRFEYEPAGEL